MRRINRTFRLISIVGLLGLLTAAGLIYSGAHALSSSRRSTRATETASETAAWSYTGFTGPLYWGTSYAPGGINEEGTYESYDPCLNGVTQSPISATSLNTKTTISQPVINPDTVTGSATNNGHAIAVGSLDPGKELVGNSQLVIDSYVYRLKQLHFHSPSEHRRWVNGTYANFDPVEMHLVHKAGNGQLAVVAVFIVPGNDTGNTEIEKVKQAVKNKNVDPISFVVGNVLPPSSSRSAFTYAGSLTTPPCTEGVTWFVMKNPIKVASTQIDWLRDQYSNNSRGAAFEQVTGQQLHWISSGEAGVWGVSGSNILYQRTGITDENMRGTGWKTWLNAVVHVSVGKKGVWIVATSSKGNQVAYTNAQGLLDLVVPTQPNITRISAGTSGVWAVDSSGQVFYRTGITDSVPTGSGWTKSPTSYKFKDITSGEFGVWGVDTSNVLYFLQGSKDGTLEAPRGSGFLRIDSNISRVSSGLLGVWALEAGSGTSQVVKSRSGITAALPFGSGWRVQDAFLNEISSGKYGVWARNSNDNVYFLSSAPVSRVGN